MQLQQIGYTTLITLLAAATTPFASEFPAQFSTPPALAQTSNARKAEAEQLLKQGLQQFKSSQFQAALHSAQQALTIYRQIGDKVKEGSQKLLLSSKCPEPG
jgi:hypothetical protein